MKFFDNLERFDPEVRAWLELKKEAALKIDPATCEVMWDYADCLDPYCVEKPEDQSGCIGREYYAREPGSDVWVAFQDLPEHVCKALDEQRLPTFTVTKDEVIWND